MFVCLPLFFFYNIELVFDIKTIFLTYLSLMLQPGLASFVSSPIPPLPLHCAARLERCSTFSLFSYCGKCT
uniref:Putative secreted protein n=1 Tax=Anopheles triannulatus TaxID=58253 RepID=A0A2M4B712_9DIPT